MGAHFLYTRESEIENEMGSRGDDALKKDVGIDDDDIDLFFLRYAER